MALHNMRRNTAAAAAILGMGALLAACSRDVSPLAGMAGTSFAAAQVAGAPIAVSCEPNQRAIVRQALVNGALQPQVQCETVGVTGGFAPAATAAYQPGIQPVSYVTAAEPIAAQDNARFVRTGYPQPVVTRRASSAASYQRAPERVYKPKRSVTKSAVIIGSSAGVGAGIGAVVGGKKGAGVGALIGGGGAALWDQITRRR